jgi:hypothetical protein
MVGTVVAGSGEDPFPAGTVRLDGGLTWNSSLNVVTGVGG